MPDRLAIHLPSSLTAKAIYERMREERGENVISQPQFYHLFREFFPHVVIPSENRFAKCDTCSLMKDEKEKTMNPERRKMLQKLLDSHLELQSQERQHYYKHRDLAQRNKREYMSIIIDGMDQSKTNLPHFTRERKSGVSLWRLRTHLTGAINHGAGVHTYIDLLVWPHDANLVINILLDVINRSAYLPPVLFLQLDNTARENKNQFILAFMAYLIQIELFSEIQLSFLMVGHTHEDVDQVFSRVSTHLQRTSAHTVEDLIECVYQSNSEIRSVTQLKQLYDYKKWLKPHIDTPHEHTNPHNFLFRLNSKKEAIMLYRNWSSDSWISGEEGEGLKLLKSKPTGQPEILNPSLEKLDLKKLKNDIPKYVRAGLPTHKMCFWENLDDELQRIISMSPRPSILCALKERKQAQEKNDDHQNEGTDPVISSTIHAALEKERAPLPQIYLGNKRKKTHCQKSQSESNATHQDSSKSVPSSTKRKRSNNQDEVQAIKKSRPTTSSHISAHSEREYQEGELVALHCVKYHERPQIGQVLEVKGSEVTIKWYDGNWRGRWKVYTYKDRTKTVVAWIETLPVGDIVLRDIKLTKSGSLSKIVKDQLRDLYNKLDSK